MYARVGEAQTRRTTRGHVANLDLLQDSQETVITFSTVVEDSDMIVLVEN